MKPYATILLPLAGILIFTGLFLIFNTDAPLRTLPKLGNHRIDKKTTDGKTMNDTVFHKIPAFSFLDQNGNVITNESVQNKICVVDYFFSTCQSICPFMSSELSRVHEAYRSNPEVIILSHTVDPQTDTPEQLLVYASQFNADSKSWKFLTGSKEELYKLARKGYLLEASEGNGGKEDFIHTQNFALVDGLGHIRGFYDGLDTTEVNNLIRDISILLREKKSEI